MFDNEFGYNQYTNLDMFPYYCVSYLLKNNEDLWKMIHPDYTDKNCLSKPNLTTTQKQNLIYNGETDSSSYRVFLEGGNNDAFTKQASLLRVYPIYVSPENKVTGVVSITFECLVHYKSGTITNANGYSPRALTMVKSIIQTLNGADVGGVGLLSLDKKSCSYDKIQYNLSNDRSFFGYSVVFSTRCG